MNADLFALQFAQASAGCAAVGLLNMAVLALAARRWPALRVARAPWLVAQLLCAAALMLGLMPQRAVVSLLPVIALTSGAQADPAPLPAAALAVAPPPPAASDWPLLVARGWCAVYLAGLCAALLRLARAGQAGRALLAAAVRDAHDDTDEGTGHALPVYRTGLPVSPMLLGVCKPVLLLPRHFDVLGAAQRKLILAHERTHLARRDPLLLHALLWFNPAMRRLQAGLFWAQEAGCDRAVLAARGASERRLYAATLIDQFRRQQVGGGADDGALAFGTASVAERLRLIRDGQGAAASALARGLLPVAAAAAVGAVLALQPAYAWRLPAAAANVTSTAAATTAVPDTQTLVWQPPLAVMRVSSAFGDVSARRTHSHAGVDLRARRGTPVLAVADGVVDSSTDLDAGGAKYGKTITILHADGHRSFYAHLDVRQVASGEPVRAGQAIALSGATGKVSGPHLHFELREGASAVDPARMPGVMASVSAAVAAAAVVAAPSRH
ncbi:M23/M56 family metallopeptidase [Massilia sp. PWRC2]|uniref:M23/M56 family metallopeptidase n=1 Tax=Massilia sp. PWRC2 TaxID=2804626 RepID=UPI003CF85E83